MILRRVSSDYSRTTVKKDKDNLYVFTDNGDRTSGKIKIPDNSEYSQRFGKTGLYHPSKTSDMLRGLENACPITTQKRYVPGIKCYNGNWTDDDFEEFKKVIDEDFEFIKKQCVDKKYKEIIFPKNGVLNGKISRLTFLRTPKLFKYIVEKELELKNFEPYENNK